MADDGKDHGDDHDSKSEGFDPWADLDAEGTAESGDGFSFSVDDIGLDASLENGFDAGLDVPPVDAPGEAVAAEAAFLAESPQDSEFVAAEEEVVPDRPAEEPTEDDAFVNAWLTEADDEPAAATPLSVFAPDDHADLGEPEDDAVEPAWPHDPAAIEIGTGLSGVTSASEVDAGGFVDEAVAEDPNAEPVEADIIDFGAAAGAAAVAAATTASGSSEPLPVPIQSAAAKPRRRGVLGQLIGVVLGGLMAVPIVLGILIGLMWLGWNDTVGIRQWWPKQASFLLPPAGSRLVTSGGPRLDDLPVTDTTAVVPDEPPAAPPTADESVPVVTTEPAAGEPAAADPAPVAEPLAVVSTETAAPPMLDALPPASVAEESPATEAVAPAVEALAAVAPPMPAVEPAPAAVPQPVPVPVAVEPEPLDLGGLEAAIADAGAALDAVQAVADPADPARKTLLVNWYKQMARVAQELAMLEHVAADSGRPLPATPAVAADLGDRVLAAPHLTDDLARLARNWLTYSRRDGDGVVMPATFASARRVGPYWCSRVAIAEAGGASRELSVISRLEPAAVPGDAVMIMGLVMDGGVLWAADVRSATAVAPATAVESDPFGQPGL